MYASTMSTPTKLGAKAANSLREKRRVGSSSGANANANSRSPGGDSVSSMNFSSSSYTNNANDNTNSYSNNNSNDDNINNNNNIMIGGGDEQMIMAHNSTDGEVLDTSMAESQASGTSNRSNVYSFFDPQEIRKPPTSPLSTSGHSSIGGNNSGNNRVVPQPFDEPGDVVNISMGSAGSGGMMGDNNTFVTSSSSSRIMGDDAASGASTGSAATERIANHKPILTAASAASGLSATDASSSSAGGNGGGGGNMMGGAMPLSAAALVASNVRPSSSTWIMEEREVKYEEGATELFMLVEDAKWEEVCDRVEEEPAEARVWVVSSGTENTVFSWSVWRRLPLHEACRRQPPPVVIYSLLSAYPESSMAESNFGELPLHAAVRCGACAEVVNSILASYPAAALARDNSGCTPLDILNGTGKMMDHDAVVAALNRTTSVLMKEEQAWEVKIQSMQHEFKQSKEKRRREYERIVANKNAEIEDLKRTLDQEKLATSGLASKVIQTERVVQDKGKLEKRYQEKMKKMEEEIRELRSANSQRKAKIKDLEDIVRSDRKTILELDNRVHTLQGSLTSLLEDEETFAATKLARAEKNFKTLMESQFVFLRETERRKDLLRNRVKQLGITIPPKKKKGEGAAREEERRMMAQRGQPMSPPQSQVDEISNNEVAEKALASAMVHLSPFDHDEDESVREV